MAAQTPDTGWDLNYDAALFLPLPAAAELAANPELAPAWVASAVAHYEEREIEERVQSEEPVEGGEPVEDGAVAASAGGLTPGDREGISITAEALLSMVEPYVTRLWFAPRDAYSDVLVSIVVTDADGETAKDVVAAVTDAPQATAADTLVVETDSHGSGVLIRRTNGVQAEEGRALLVAQWDLLLQHGNVLIAINAMGTTLPVFARLESELMPLVEGIVLPEPVAS